MNKSEFIKLIKGKVIVSVQGVDGEPTNDERFLAISARAVVAGGAQVLRCSQTEHIKAIKEEVGSIPIIGLIKRTTSDSEVFITPNKIDIDNLAKLGIECIALDATLRRRPNGEELEDLVTYARKYYPDIALMADCSNEDDITNADKLGFDLVSTTLRGYTGETKGLSNTSNNFEFPVNVSKKIDAPLIIEGGIWTPEQAKEALAHSYAIVVGSAITRPHQITEKYMKAAYNK